MQQALEAWTSQASHLIGDYFDEAKPILDPAYLGLPPLVHFVSTQLFIDCHLSSESVLLLLRQQKQWDADLICRAVLEGSVKFTYMLTGSMDEIESKVREYWHVLPLFSTIRHGEHARAFLNGIPDPTAPEWRPMQELLVDTDEVARIRANHSRRDRQLSEEKWSFFGICKALASDDDETIRATAGLAHGYSMSSHLLHKDADGIGMVWERASRSPERRHAVTMGHSARIVSDVCAFAKLRLFMLHRAFKVSSNRVAEIDARFEALHKHLQIAIDDFHRVEYEL